jgi:hypothetical protein
MKKVTGQAISRIFKDESIPRSKWMASGRVRGWGSRSHGVSAEQRQRFDENAGGGIRTKNGWKRDSKGNMVMRGAWRRDTGIWDVTWYDFERSTKRHERADEWMGRFIEACRAKGWTVEQVGDDKWEVR